MTGKGAGSLWTCSNWKPSVQLIRGLKPTFVFNSVPIDLDRIVTAITHFSDRDLLVVGDIMLDEYLWGEVERISPEAPVQVVDIQRQSYTLGGSGNVVNNLVALGAKVHVSGVIGNDSIGDVLKNELQRMEVGTDGIFFDPNRRTTKKTRIIAANQQVVRLDYETRARITDGLENKIITYVKDNLPIFDAILISDYAKGVLTRRLLAEIIIACKDQDKPILVDPKGSDFSKYRGATAITPNKKEAAMASGLVTGSVEEAGDKFLSELNLEAVLITKGKEGMSLFIKGESPFHIPARVKEVYDVSGAGDTVLASFGLALSSGLTHLEAAILANVAAGIVVGKVGTATASQEELLGALVGDIPFAFSKIRERHELKQVVNYLKAQGKTIVFTNGCFDLLHTGHIHLLKESKKLGDILIVALDTDESVRRLKGNNRPIISQNERAQILSSLDCVDYVTIFSTDELKDLIGDLKPDILTKGSDYQKEEVVGKEIVERHGGKMALIPITEDTSSSKIISNILNKVPSFQGK